MPDPENHAISRNPDLVVLALALPVFLVAGWPVLGWLTALVVWVTWRGVGELAARKASAADDPRRIVGITTGSMIGRGWLMGLTLLGAGLAFGDDVGLSAAVLSVVLFTVSFTSRLVLRPIEGPHTPTP